MSHPTDLPPELLDAARALEDHRPHLTEPELARVKRRIVGAASPATSRPRRGFVKSRVAITAMLASGALMSSGGAALGVSALSTDLRSGSAQYGAPVVTPPVTGGQQSPAGTGDTAAAEDSLGGNGQGAGRSTPTATATAAAQAPRQLETSSADQLPFTGFAAIPLLLIGLGLLIGGLVLRRGTHRAPTEP